MDSAGDEKAVPGRCRVGRWWLLVYGLLSVVVIGLLSLAADRNGQRLYSVSIESYGLLCMAASGWIDIIHYTYIHTYKHTYKDDATIYTMQ